MITPTGLKKSPPHVRGVDRGQYSFTSTGHAKVLRFLYYVSRNWAVGTPGMIDEGFNGDGQVRGEPTTADFVAVAASFDYTTSFINTTTSIRYQ